MSKYLAAWIYMEQQKQADEARKQQEPLINAQVQAAQTQSDIARESLDWAKEQAAIENERQKATDDLARLIAGKQIEAQDQSMRWAAEDRDRYQTTFQPLQDQFINTAQNWASPEKQAQAAAEARADVINAARVQEQARGRQMSAMGVSPDSGRFAGVERAADTETALAAAGAENNARSQLKKEAVALQADAIGMGSGLPSQASQALGLGVSSGSSAIGTTAAANANRQLGLDIMRTGYGTAMQGNAGAISGYGAAIGGFNSLATLGMNASQGLYSNYSSAKAVQAQSDAGLASGIGSLVGAGISNAKGIGSAIGSLGTLLMSSDKNVKENKRPALGILDALKKIPVDEWDYKEGEGDGGSHVGPYAQDFQKATGKGDGKTINVIDAIGVTMGAVKELDAKVDKIVASTERGVLEALNRPPAPRGGRGVKEALQASKKRMAA